MLGLWTGTALQAAQKTTLFIGVASGTFFLVAALIPYLILNRATGRWRVTLAYIAGSVVTFALIVATLFYLEEAENVPPIVANDVFRGMAAVLFGPAIGVWAARRVRRRRLKTIPTEIG